MISRKINLDEFAITCPIGLCAGILSYFAFNEHLGKIIIFFILIILSSLLSRNKIETKILYAILLFSSFFYVGILSSHIRWTNNKHYEVQTRKFYKKIKGKIIDQVKIREKARVTISTKIDDNHAIIRLNSISQNLKDANIGDEIEIANVFINPIPKSDSNISRDLYFNKIAGLGFFKQEIKILKKSSKKNLRTILFSIKSYISRKFDQNLSKENASIITTMLLGKKANQEISPQTKDILRSAGLSHLLAISGIHFYVIQSKIINLITLLIILIFLITKNEFFHHHLHIIKSVITIILGFFYLQLIDCPISAKRAFLMLFLSLFAEILNRTHSSKFTLKLSSIIILINSPEYLFSPSFQMSFLSVAAILYNSNYDKNIKTFKPFQIIKSNIKQSILISIAIAPCSCYYFGSFSISGIIANVFAIPLVSYIILPMGLISSLMFFINIPNVKIFFFLLNLSIKTFIFIAKKCQKLDLEFFATIDDKIVISLTVITIAFITTQNKPLKSSCAFLIISILLLQKPDNFKNPDIYLGISGDMQAQIMSKTSDGNLQDISGKRKNFIKNSWLKSYGQTNYIVNKKENLSKKDSLNINIKQCPFEIKIKRFPKSNKIKNIELDNFIKIKPEDILVYGTHKIYLINCNKIKIEKENFLKRLLWTRCHNWESNPNLVLTKDAL